MPPEPSAATLDRVEPSPELGDAVRRISQAMLQRQVQETRVAPELPDTPPTAEAAPVVASPSIESGGQPSGAAPAVRDPDPEPAPASTPDPTESQRSAAEAERLGRELRAAAEQRAEDDAKQRRAKVLEVVGPDEDYQRLSRRKALNEQLDFDEDTNLEQWTRGREHFGPLLDLGRAEGANNVLAVLAEQVGREATRPGVDPAKLKASPDLSAMMGHFHEAGASSVRAELEPQLEAKDNRIAALEAELTAARGQRAGQAHAPERGGRAAALPPQQFASGATPMQKVLAGLRAQQDQRP